MLNNQKILAYIFQTIYNRSIDINNFEDRKLTQKTVYLLNELGVSCGDYSFCWDTYGPFSLKLNNDIKIINGNDLEYIKRNHSNKLDSVFDWFENLLDIRDELDNSSEIPVVDFMELVASLHYLKYYQCSALKKDKIVEILLNLKPQFKNQTVNEKAYDLCCTI